MIAELHAAKAGPSPGFFFLSKIISGSARRSSRQAQAATRMVSPEPR